MGIHIMGRYSVSHNKKIRDLKGKELENGKRNIGQGQNNLI
jgi:hypothetical protein